MAKRVLARGTRLAPLGRPAIVNGAAGVVVVNQRPVAVVRFTVAAGRVVELDLITDPGRLDGVAGPLVDA